jgi:5-methylcytosine-specific restriction endonuclease McrA
MDNIPGWAAGNYDDDMKADEVGIIVDPVLDNSLLNELRNLYWTTDIPVPEIRDAYLSGFSINAVSIVAGPVRLTTVCTACRGPLFATSRSELIQFQRQPPWYCLGCRSQLFSHIQADHIQVESTSRPTSSKMAYENYLQSDGWKERRDRALRRAGFSCQVCSKKGQLHVHHRTYARRGDEADTDLIVLCADCHQLFHENGKLAEGGRAL